MKSVSAKINGQWIDLMRSVTNQWQYHRVSHTCLPVHHVYASVHLLSALQAVNQHLHWQHVVHLLMEMAAIDGNFLWYLQENGDWEG